MLTSADAKMFSAPTTVNANSKSVLTPEAQLGWVKQAAILTIAMGLAVLSGWAWNIGILKSILPGIVSMKANHAFAFTLSGMCLYLHTLRQTPLPILPARRATAILVLLIGLATLSEYYTGRNIGIDQLLFGEPDGALLTSHPGRMSVISAMSLVLIGGALLLMEARLWMAAQAMAIAMAVFMLLPLGGYMFGNLSLTRIGDTTSIAAHSTIGFLVLAVGILGATQNYGLMLWLRKKSREIGLAGALVALVFVAGATHYHFEQKGKSAQWLEHTYKVIKSMETFSAAMHDFLHHNQAYLIASDDRQLVERNKARNAVFAELAKVRQLVSTDPTQIERLAALDKLVRQNMESAYMQERMYRKRGISAVTEVIRDGTGSNLIDGIETSLDQIERVEVDLLTERQRLAEIINSNSSFTLSTLLVGSLALLLSIFRSLQREIAWRKEAEQTLLDASTRLTHLIASGSNLLFSMRVVGEKLQTNWVSDNLGDFLGYTKEEVMQPDWWFNHMNPKDRDRVAVTLVELFNGKPVSLDYRIKHKNGHEIWIHDEQKLVCDKQGKPVEVVSSWSDITKHKMAELELRIAAITFDSHEGIVITDANKVIQRVNQAFTQMTGYSSADVMGKTPSVLSSGRQDAEFYREMWRAIEHEDFWQGEIWNRRKNGEVFPEWLTITAIRDGSNNITNYVGAFHDISESKEAEERIRSLAFYDPLTKLPNRRLLHDRLQQAVAASTRSRKHGALMLLDLDRFKILNDTHGHGVGDQLLLEAAQRLKSNVREGDTVARLGGDEFVVLLGALDEYTNEAAAQAQLLADKIRTVLAEPYHLSIQTEKQQLHIVHHSSSSIGVVLFLGHETSVEELLKRADLAMYEAKHGGRDAICFFDPAMQLALNARAALEEHMRQALAEQYRLHYQIQVDEQGYIVGAEALLRWQHPERGLLMPDEFIPLAEETGLVVPIGKWVLQTACAQLKAWESNPLTRDLKIAVNISACQFRQEDFVEHVRSALEQTGARATLLELEITESLILNDIEDTIAKMRQLKQVGVNFSMDDFGTGYSSLSNLQRLPLNQIKIDQSFIRDMAADAGSAVIVNAILTMGKSLGMEVVAEGVETEGQREFLAQQGCCAYQGFLFGRPVPVAEFELLLNRS